MLLDENCLIEYCLSEILEIQEAMKDLLLSTLIPYMAVKNSFVLHISTAGQIERLAHFFIFTAFQCVDVTIS